MKNSKLRVLLHSKEVKKNLIFAFINIVSIFVLLSTCHSSESMALTAFTFLLIFDLFNILTAILNDWIKIQDTSASFPYGYKRCEVLAVFASVMLSILASFFILKECVEKFFEEEEVHTARMIPASLIAYIVHMLIVMSVKNTSVDYVIQASSSSWLQEHVADISETLCRFIPGLSRLLLPRINPFSLLGTACLLVNVGVYFSLQWGSSYLYDTAAAIFISIMTFGTMLPMAVYTAKILLQTTPSHMIAQLDKTLREASTLDGVLEFRNEHFWTVSFGAVVGSLHVRVRRDADEQIVLAHVWNKLAGLVQVLTIHIFKDDWIRRSTHQLVYNSNATSNSPQFNQSTPTSSSNYPTKPILGMNPQNSDTEYVIVNP